MKTTIIETAYGDRVCLEPRLSLAGTPLIELETAIGADRHPIAYAALGRKDARRLHDWLTEWLEETKR